MILIEASSGKVLHAENAGHPWYPASVTKVMTAYVTLRAVKEGRLSLDKLLTVSANAVAQGPTKMGFKQGSQVTVDNALKMLMVKSANDIAVVLAEGVSGSIADFSEEMNKAARRLGMTQTTYVNPNGLPADAQITSVRDQAMLARAIYREMPEYEMYWHISAIQIGKRVMRNYNSLIDRYPGADGMKTGFICASGFNVLASATRNNRRLIAVVFGSPSGAVRAVKTANLLERGFNTGGLNWLAPSLGTVEMIQPVSAEPPNLREQTCGKNRKRPAAETEDLDVADLNAQTPGDPSSAQSVLLSSLKPGVAKPSALLGEAVQTGPTIVVYLGASKDAVTLAAKPAKSKKGVSLAIAGGAIPASAVAAAGAPTQLTAPAFAPTAPNYPSTTAFKPATLTSTATAAPQAVTDKPAAPKKKKTAKKPAATAETAGTAAATTKPATTKPATPSGTVSTTQTTKPASKSATRTEATAKPADKPAPR